MFLGVKVPIFCTVLIRLAGILVASISYSLVTGRTPGGWRNYSRVHACGVEFIERAR